MLSGFVCIAALSLVGLVAGHGRMVEPAARNVMWRFGYKNNRNYNDMGLNCGGFPNQFEQNHGKCGVCGDPYQGPRDHEAGGKYARGLVVRQYPGNAIVNVTVELTSNHMGYFEFRLCPVNDPHKKVTQACLDRFLLNIIGHGTRFYIQRREMSINVELAVMLPPGLLCTQCVLQWKWVAGQSMGPDGKGGECMGCGNQENFINCADIAIGNKKVAPLPMPIAGPDSPAVTDNAAKDWRDTSVVPTGPVSAGTNVQGTKEVAYKTYNPPAAPVGYNSKPDQPTSNSISPSSTTASWYHDPNANYNKMNDFMSAHNTLYDGTAQPWNENPSWYAPEVQHLPSTARTTSKPLSMQQKMQFMQQMFPTLMENFEWPSGEHQQQQQYNQYNHQQSNNGEGPSGLEPGEYPEVSETPSPSYNTGGYSRPSVSGSFQDPSYAKGFQDALRHLKETLGIQVDTPVALNNGNVKPGSSLISSAVNEAQKYTPFASQTSYLCPDGVAKPACKGINSWAGNPEFDTWCVQTCTTGDCPSNFCHCSCPTVENWTGGPKCQSVDRSKAANMDRWCSLNCQRGNCPENLCFCV